MWSIYTFILKPKCLLKEGEGAFTRNDRSDASPVPGTVTITQWATPRPTAVNLSRFSSGATNATFPAFLQEKESESEVT